MDNRKSLIMKNINIISWIYAMKWDIIKFGIRYSNHLLKVFILYMEIKHIFYQYNLIILMM